MLRHLFTLLAPYNPVLAGTFPLGLQTDTSDLDILCEARDLPAFETFLHTPWRRCSQAGTKSSAKAWMLSTWAWAILTSDRPSEPSTP